MKLLQKQIEGKGEMRGFTFNRLKESTTAYLYEVKNEFNNVHYEVIMRLYNSRFDCESYPSSKGFGKTAWCYRSYEPAENKFSLL